MVGGMAECHASEDGIEWDGMEWDGMQTSLGGAPGMVMPPSVLLSNKGGEAVLSDQEVSQPGDDHLEATWTQRKNRGHLVDL